MAAKVKSANITNSTILGVFDGETMDTTITNLNGLDITAEVMDAVFESDEYKQGIDKGWYIGFLGHPEDPNEMGFQDGCIVMTEGHMDDSGKVYGKFNLIDTPVGRVVKTFIDAGVKFGISIRGAGDIENNSVDPETFVFRGFDLVSFPAYPDSVPKFTEIAASTDAKDRAKYKKICASIATNLQDINSIEALDIIQSNFAPQSKEFKMLEDRRKSIEASDIISINDAKITGMTELYIEAVEANKNLLLEIESLKKQVSKYSVTANQRLAKIRRIVGNQLSVVTTNRDELVTANEELVQAASESKLYQRELERNNRLLEQSIGELEAYIKELELDNKKLSKRIASSENSNLIYSDKIESHKAEIRKQADVIASLRAELDETVNGASDLEDQTSNLDERNKDLDSKIKASNRLLRAYQNAYSKLYASAIGSDYHLDSLSITASTSVPELQKIISASSNNLSGIFAEPEQIDLVDGDLDNNVIIL